MMFVVGSAWAEAAYVESIMMNTGEHSQTSVGWKIVPICHCEHKQETNSMNAKKK